MKKCKFCGSPHSAEVIIAEYVDDKLGYPIVVHNAVKQVQCHGCGKSLGVIIPNLVGLIAAVAVDIATTPEKLWGAEIRFLRKALGWKAKELAEKLEVSAEQVSRWENDAIPISLQTERYLRLVVCTLLGKDAPRIKWTPDEIVGMKIRPKLAVYPVEPLRFELVCTDENEKDCGEQYTQSDTKAA